MEINADFSQRVVVHTAELEWKESPMQGVHRRMLDRVGGEVARATSIVRYAPNSKFSAHVHTGGEEFIVLEGVFQDEHGDFPAGSYIRNPPQSRHTPGSDEGCIIFVKLWQFDLNDRTPIRTTMDNTGTVQDADRSNVSVGTLFADERETVRLEHWAAISDISVDASQGAEILVLDGSFSEGGDTLQPQSWMRLPCGYTFTAMTGSVGARVWVKTGHVQFADEEVDRLPG